LPLLACLLACLLSLACHAAKIRWEDGEYDAKVLVMTLLFPTDTRPIDAMVKHRQRMLCPCGESTVEDVVLYNQPPEDVGVKIQQEQKDLQRVRLEVLKNQSVKVEHVPWDRLDDDTLFRRLFKPPTSIRQLVRDGSWHHGTQLLEFTNFMGMATAFMRCLESDHDFCVFFDEDVFLYHKANGHSLFHLAAEIFEKNTEIAILQAPNMCGSSKSSTSCAVQPTSWMSGRYMIAQRERLSKIFPLSIPEKGMQSWEITFSDLVQNEVKGKMECGNLAWAIHPPSRFSPQSTPEDITAHIQWEEVARRIENGSFRASEDSTTNNCEDMVASSKMVQKDFAWMQLMRRCGF